MRKVLSHVDILFGQSRWEQYQNSTYVQVRHSLADADEKWYACQVWSKQTTAQTKFTTQKEFSWCVWL